MVKGSCNPGFGRGSGGDSIKPAEPRPAAANGTAARCGTERLAPVRPSSARCLPALLLVGCLGPACRIYTHPRRRAWDRPLVSCWEPLTTAQPGLSALAGQNRPPSRGSRRGESGPHAPAPRRRPELSGHRALGFGRRGRSALVRGPRKQSGDFVPSLPGAAQRGRAAKGSWYISTACSHPCAERSDSATRRPRCRESLKVQHHPRVLALIWPVGNICPAVFACGTQGAASPAEPGPERR